MRGRQYERESSGKHHHRRKGVAPQRVDRPTTCPAALRPNDSLFDTLSDRGALPGTSALGWQTAYRVAVGPPPPFPARGEGDEQMKAGKTEWQVKGEWQCQKREAQRDAGEGMYRICPLLPGDLKEACIIGIFHLQIINPTHPVTRLPDASLEISGFT